MEILIRLLLAIVPGLFYVYFYRNYINKLTPIAILDTSKFIGLGLFSILLLVGIYSLFPFLAQKPLFLENINLIIFVYSFCQVAFLEELSKFWSFKIINKKYNQLQTQYFYALVGMGFSLFENIEYAFKLSATNDYVLSYNHIIARDFTAVLLHFSIGIIIGFFVSKGKSIYGLLLGIFLHGLYDYKLMSANSKLDLLFWIIFIVGCSVYISIKMIDELKNEIKK